jgi:hypothetical protein
MGEKRMTDREQATKLTKTRTSIAVAAISATVRTARPIFPSLGFRDNGGSPPVQYRTLRYAEAGCKNLARHGPEQEEPLRAGQIAPDLNSATHGSRCSYDRVGSSGDACRRNRLVPLPVLHTLAPSLFHQSVELTEANLFVLEQPAQRMELHRVVLVQHFGRGSELDRIGPPGVVSEPGFDLFEVQAGPEERTGFDAFGRPISFRTAYYVGRSVHRFRSGDPRNES